MSSQPAVSPSFLRVIFAGMIGGALVFFCGFVAHMIFNWSGRTFSQLPDEGTFRTFFADQRLQPGIYMFPAMSQADKSEAEWNRVAALYKTGPNALIVVHPTGQEMMDGSTLGMEFLSNVIAALLAAWVVSLLGSQQGFLTRCAVVVAIGLFAWFSIAVSFQIWYRFPWPFIRDELLCALMEWAVAGIAIAAIVRSRAKSTPQ